MSKLIHSLWVGGLIMLWSNWAAFAQEKTNAGHPITKESYLIGEEKNLDIIVHIWGEVKNPGEKRVPDGTNVLELISKAGGPTEYSSLSRVVLFSNQSLHQGMTEASQLDNSLEKFMRNDLEKLRQTGKVELDINKYLRHGQSRNLPRLMPGDVVNVKRNTWYTWQTLVRVASQMAIVAQVWYWYNRTNQ
jgi:hypothetical protein